jgi:NADH:ubiquinone oxidoreductase subunit D
MRDAMYELWQTLDGKRVQRFFAVVNGTLRRIPRDSVERIAEGALTLKEWASSVAQHVDAEIGGVL